LIYFFLTAAVTNGVEEGPEKKELEPEEKEKATPPAAVEVPAN